MPNSHFSIKIIQRSEGQSAVAAAAYQSGEKLYSDYDQAVKNYPEKRGILHSEILLPAHAPPAYADRNTLWNAVEKIEKQWNSQLARRFEIAIPREIPVEQYADLVRDYCREFFVSKGMCVDFAIHDPYPPGHNPHAHLLLTMRAMDESGKWLPKSRKVYDLDENGERIRLPSGYWKSHKENTVDWSEQSNAETWRQGWADWQNRYLEQNGCSERADLRSYERQGIDKIPTVHMGPAVAAMERRGIQTDVGNLNREISRLNRIMQSIKNFIRDLKEFITELRQAEEEMRAEQMAKAEGSLTRLLMRYMDIRKEERKNWSHYGRSKATSADLKKVSEALGYVHRLGLETADDLEAHIIKSEQEAKTMYGGIRQKEKRIKEIDCTFSAMDNIKKYRSVYEKYASMMWKKSREKFKQEHPEVAAYLQAKNFLDKQSAVRDLDPKKLRKEKSTLASELAEAVAPMERMKADLKRLRDIRYWVRKAMPGTPESREAPPRESMLENLREAQRTEKKEHRHETKKQDRER